MKRRIKNLEKMIVTLYENEMSAENISIATGISLEVVNAAISGKRLLEFFCSSKPAPAAAQTEREFEVITVKERNKRIRELRMKGESVESLAVKTKLSEATIRVVVSGISTQLKKKRDEGIVRRFESGESAKELAERELLTVGMIYKICQGKTSENGNGRRNRTRRVTYGA